MATTIERQSAAVDQIAAQLRHVAELRRQQSEISSEIKKAESAFRDSIKAQTEDARRIGDELGAAESKLRTMTLEHYAQTGEAKPTVGVEVKRFTKLEYDLQKADEWTRERKLARIPESLDKNAFEKIARATPIEFVVVKEIPKVMITRDLEKALGKATQ
jgi:hypothetical protein